jgi:two-component system chemotaxis response regulator CheY
MNVLIVDDEPMTRSLLRRVLIREFGCTVVEATNGLEALSAAGGSKPVSLIVTDLRMPVMDGIELLEALRQVPPLAGIPVVMMSAARESGPVQRAIELGVTDYLLKPLEAAKVAARLRSVVDRLAKAKEAASRAAVEASAPMLIADGHADFRLFFASSLPGRTIHQAETGVAALQRCVATRPAVVFVGIDLGVLGPELLVRKLRATPEMASARIVALVPSQAMEQGAVPALVDGVVTRTFVADTFRSQVDRLLGTTSPDDFFAAHPTLPTQMAAAADQAFGLMLQLEVTTSFEVDTRPVEHLVSATASFAVAGTHGRTLTLTLRGDRAAAQIVASGLNAAAAAKAEGGAEPAATVDAPGGLAELVGIIASRLRTALEGDGVHATVAPPEGIEGGPGDLAGAGDAGLRVAITTADGNVAFVLQLTAGVPATATTSASTTPRAPETAPAS